MYVLLLQTIAQAPLAVPVALSGAYQGTLKPIPSVSLTLIFRVGGTDAAPTATLDVPEQGAKNVSVPKTTVSGDAVTFDLPNIGARFTGKRSADGATITGTFTQGGRDFPLVLTRTDKPLVLERPQTPKPPFPYRTVEVSYPNPKAPGVTLAGTLTVPGGAGRFPVALFITGSGAQDRDETILGHKPFAVIADALARRGIASLRVDDRGVGKSVGGVVDATTLDFAGDVRAGIAFLRRRSEIDSKRIGLIGHSEGGVIAPIVAANNPEVAFVVLLAGTGVRGDQVMLAQRKAITDGMGGEPAPVAAFNNGILETIRTATSPADARTKVEAKIAERVKSLPEGTRTEAKKQLEAALLPWCGAWAHTFLSLDPQVALVQTTCPVLALNGSLDKQVIAAQNLPAIEAALKKGGNKNATVRELPGLNHLFQTATTGLPGEYAAITQTVAPEVLTLIGDWITAHTKP